MRVHVKAIRALVEAVRVLAEPISAFRGSESVCIACESTTRGLETVAEA